MKFFSVEEPQSPANFIRNESESNLDAYLHLANGGDAHFLNLAGADMLARLRPRIVVANRCAVGGRMSVQGSRLRWRNRNASDVDFARTVAS